MDTWGDIDDDNNTNNSLFKEKEAPKSETILSDSVQILLNKIVEDQKSIQPSQSDIKNRILMDSLEPMSVIKTKDKGGFLKFLVDVNKLSKIGILDDNLAL